MVSLSRRFTGRLRDLGSVIHLIRDALLAHRVSRPSNIREREKSSLRVPYTYDSLQCNVFVVSSTRACTGEDEEEGGEDEDEDEEEKEKEEG